jgi:Tol biopolymer transport system component
LIARANAVLLLAALCAATVHAQPPRAHIAFIGYENTKPGIFVMNDDGSERRRLTTGSDSPPTWSPDGCNLVFRRGLTDVYIINIFGTPERLVAQTVRDNAANDHRIFFSPDGSQLLIGANDAHFVVSARSPQSTDLRGHPDPLFSGYSPVWSPDGKRIAYESRGNVRVIGADGSDDVTLGPGRIASWDHRGSRVTFLTQEGPTTVPSLAVVKATGEPVVTMTLREPVQPIQTMTWSPDATMAAFAGWDELKSRAGLFVMNADGSGVKGIGPPGDNVQLSWAPDSKRLTFSTGSAKPSQPGSDIMRPDFSVYTANADGSSLKKLTDGHLDQSPVWSPAACAK